MKAFISVLTLLIVSIGAASAYAADVTLAWDPNAEPVDGYRLYYGTSSGSYTQSMEAGTATQATLTGLDTDTTYYIVVRAYDVDGESGDSNEVTWQQSTPDTTAPSVSVTGPTQTTNAAVTLSGTASDNVAVTAVTWVNDRGGSGTAQGTAAWTAANVSLQEGVNTITVTATDGAGNSGTDSIQITRTIPDTDAPSVQVSGPSATSTPSVTLTGTASDNVAVTAVTWRNDRGGSGTAQGTAAWTAANISLQAGVNTITVTATDAAGNSGTGSIQVTYTLPDTTAPTVSVSGPSQTQQQTADLSGTAADNQGVVSVTWRNDRGGSGTAQGTSSWTAAGISLQEGVNVITVTATDAAGNSGTGSIQITRTLPDVDAPSVQVSGPSVTANPTITLTGTASDNDAVTSVTWVNDRGGSGTAQGTNTWTAANITLQEGVNVITFTATDAAGNRGTTGLQVVLDTTPPAPPVGIRVSGM